MKSSVLSALLGLSSATVSKGRCPEQPQGFTNLAPDLKPQDLDRRWYYVYLDNQYMVNPQGEGLPEGVLPECLITDSFSSLDQWAKLKH
jgi:hypothetical protein